MRVPAIPAAMAVLGTVLAVGLVVRADGDRGREDHSVEELMERTHEGRRSPYRRLGRIVDGETVAWPEVERLVQEFDPMCRALLASKNDDIKGSADGYVEAVKEIWAAAKRRDAAGVKSGYTALKDSCGDCHFDGGVGGELED
jgi:hypothetical protein